MGSVAIFKTGQYPRYLESVNTPDYSSDTDAIINPNISSVNGVPTRYWKRSGNSILEMTTQEKAAVDAADLLARKSAADTFSANDKEVFTALIKVINLRLPAGQKITRQELVDAIKEEII